MNTSKNIFRMAERISKIDDSDIIESLKSMTKDKVHINYGREKILVKRLEKVLKEVNIWNFKIDSSGTIYTKTNGQEKWIIKLKNGKVTQAQKQINGKVFPLNPSIVNDFKKKVLDEAIGQRVTVNKTGEYPAQFINGKDVDKLFFVRIGDRGQIHKKDNKGAWIWLDNEFETLIWVPKNEYR